MIHQPTRRNALALLGATLAPIPFGFAQSKPARKILLRSSWQTVNIGDIAHTPGVLHILEQHLPEVEVTLWPSVIDNGVDEILLRRFPGLKIAKSKEAVKEAFQTCDFLLHGSGASLVAERDVIRWHEETGKPFGIYGITFPLQKSSATTPRTEEALAKTIQILNEADFVYFRDSRSLALAAEKGCNAPVMEFGPDGAFACDLRRDDKADAFLSENKLEENQFLCCIPRLRYTPYWTIKDRPKDEIKHARNEEMKEHDHAPHRAAIRKVLEETDFKILLCPEDRTQMTVGKELIYDTLTDTEKQRVVWKPDYWLTGEAVSTYRKSAGLFGNEMHSPIMCIGHGIPAIVCRWAEQTSKGYMWEDIGLKEWLHNFDEKADVERLPDTVLNIATNQEAALKKAAKARFFVEAKQKSSMQTLAKSLQLS